VSQNSGLTSSWDGCNASESECKHSDTSACKASQREGMRVPEEGGGALGWG